MNARRGRTDEPMPGVALPITPMLDMAFQLLTFFIFTYHPSGLEGQLPLALPSGPNHQKGVEGAPKNPGGDLEFPAELTVSVRALQGGGPHDGDISALSVRNADGKEQALADLPALQEYLTKAPRKEAIKVAGDGKLKVKSTLKVLDACRRAGFRQVSLVAP
jgi:biopolymer transport protein ExbD